MRIVYRTFGACLVAAMLCTSPLARESEPTPASALKQAQRILFLGDSITASGQYVAWFDAWLLAQPRAAGERPPRVINCGLASETVSGLSEEGHAGGQFPRPHLHDRLARVLELTKPNLVVACYGMNCGIYQPFDEERFAKYREGIEALRAQVERAGAKLVLVTPPCYDDARSPKENFQYNDVLARYREWLLEQRTRGWLVIDLHGPMTHEVKRRREAEPQFTFQPDGVHPNNDGHWFIARQLMLGFGDTEAGKWNDASEMLAARNVPAEALALIEERMRVTRDAYVHAAGHKRPGVQEGLPLDEAERKVEELTDKIESVSPTP